MSKGAEVGLRWAKMKRGVEGLWDAEERNEGKKNSMLASVYIYTYIHTYIHTDRQTDRHTNIHTYIHTYIYTYLIDSC